MRITGLLRTGLFAAFAARTSATVVVAHYMVRGDTHVMSMLSKYILVHPSGWRSIRAERW